VPLNSASFWKPLSTKITESRSLPRKATASFVGDIALFHLLAGPGSGKVAVRAKGGGPYSLGALAHFFKNRFYIGEVVYRGETHTGEHAPIIDRPTFEAVQALLAQNARARQVRLNGSPAILMGRIFDDRGNRMTPSHSNKDGVRYRYY
jgi:hypothetical protein